MHKTRETSHARRAIIQERKRQRQYEKWRLKPPVTVEDMHDGTNRCEHPHLDRITDEDYGCHDCGAPFIVQLDAAE